MIRRREPTEIEHAMHSSRHSSHGRFCKTMKEMEKRNDQPVQKQNRQLSLFKRKK